MHAASKYLPRTLSFQVCWTVCTPVWNCLSWWLKNYSQLFCVPYLNAWALPFLPCLNEFSGVAPSGFRLSRQTDWTEVCLTQPEVLLIPVFRVNVCSGSWVRNLVNKMKYVPWSQMPPLAACSGFPWLVQWLVQQPPAACHSYRPPCLAPPSPVEWCPPPEANTLGQNWSSLDQFVMKTVAKAKIFTNVNKRFMQNGLTTHIYA